MAMTLDCYTGSPYQNLANAIVAEACNEWRDTALYLKDHPTTPEMRLEANKRKALRREAIRTWTERQKRNRYKRLKTKRHRPWWEATIRAPQSIGNKLMPYSDLELYVAMVRKKQDELKDLEAWFFSPAYDLLTDLDPSYLLRELRKEVDYAN